MKNKRFYFIGIKGSGMAGLASILKDLGYDVVGSDIEKYVFTQEHLDAHGITYYNGFNPKNLKDEDVVVIGNAFDDSNDEVKAALENDAITCIRYPKFLHELVNHYNTCCVVGTHGKTNTTGLLAHVINTYEPSGYLIGDGTGHMEQDAEFFALEACEYKRNFLNYQPNYAIVLNIELDHVDYYKDLVDYIDAFQSFVNQVKKGIAIFGDQEETRNLKTEVPTIYYGFDHRNDVYADNIVTTSEGMEFDCYLNGTKLARFFVPLFGKHLLANVLGVITIALMNNMPLDLIDQALRSYQGTDRRFVVEEVNNHVYIDDYAHHPTAIEATIKAAKAKYPNRKIIAIFKPDRYSRIAYFLDRFNDAFKEADETFICDFPSNAVKEEGIDLTIDDLINKIDNAKLLGEDQKGVETLASIDNAVYLFMSSKDIYKLKDQLKKYQNEGE